MLRTTRIETLRLTPREHEALVRALEAREKSEGRTQERKAERWSYHRPDGLVLRIQQPGGDAMDFLVRPRNLSTGGLGFLHGGFVYPGSICIVTLVSHDGSNVVARGKVVRCACVTGRIHDIGVQFDAPIEIDNFVVKGGDSNAGMPEVLTDAEYDTDTLVPLARRLLELIENSAPINDVRVAWVAMGRLLQPPRKSG